MSRKPTHEDGIIDEDDELALLADPDLSDYDKAEIVAAPPERCDAEVWESPGYFDRHDCPRPGKRWVGGKWLCGIHAGVAERQAARRR